MTALHHGANMDCLPPTWQWLDTVDSTNSFCQRQIPVSDKSVQSILVATDHQTSGRGRSGRTWTSEQGRSLCLSYARLVKAPPARIAQVPLAAGYAIGRFFKAMGLPVQLKWPNDVLAMGKKLAGVLCESFPCESSYWVVVGVGVNLRPIDVADALGGAGAIALEQLCSEATARELLDAPVLSQTLGLQIHQAVGQVLNHGLLPWIEPIKQMDAWLGQPVCVIDQGQVSQRGIACGINDEGYYQISTGQQTVAVIAGDLSLRVA